MRGIFQVLLVAGIILAPPSARAELQPVKMMAWLALAWKCGHAQQIFVSAGLEHLVPDLESRTLARAERMGASEVQLMDIGAAFKGGQERALEKGFHPGLEIDETDRRHLEYAAPVYRDGCAVTFP